MRARGYLAFIIGLCATAALCLFVTANQEQQIRNNFQRDAEKVARDTSVRLHTYFDMLLSLKGMYALDGQIDRLKFHRYVGELDLARRYPGFQAIQFVRSVPAEALPQLTAAVRGDRSIDAQGYPQFLVHPVQQRAQHYVIEYTEPLKGNENAFGLDLAALPPHLRALELGRDSGEIIATERITLVQDASGQAGFVARAPVYRLGVPLDSVEQRRAALLGFVAIVFRVNALMHEVVETSMLEHLRVVIHDTGYAREAASPLSGDNLMFDSQGKQGADSGAAPALPGLEASVSLMVGERRWLLQFYGREGTRFSRTQLPVLVIALAGTLISALVAALLITSQRVVDAKHGLEHSLGELEQQKTKVELARQDLSAVQQTLRRAQNDLITSEKMASLGALVAGIAHELNTPIGNTLLTATALSDMVQEFQRRLKEEGGIKRSALESHLADACKACDIMTGALGRAAELINSFKQVAVDQSSGQRRRFLLDSVVHDMLATYSAQLRMKVCQVEVDVAPGLEFDSYPGSLSQVLSNLIGNALLHGFDGRECGTISISAWRDGADNVRLVFRDDGVGMSERTLHQVFDPFFTTKMGQGGSGLGMNIVYNIVTGVLKGSIEVMSTPGQGTSITLLLPMHPAESAQEEPFSARVPAG
jgi:signal transduction histidine kinase